MNYQIQHIKQYYKVPAKIGGRVSYKGTPGTIVGAQGSYLKIRLDGQSKVSFYHPVWEIEYLPDDHPEQLQPEKMNNQDSIHPIILLLIHNEVKRAQEKHPDWPEDIIHASAIVAEECGELTRAALQFTYESGDIKAVQDEAVQVAAAAIRLLQGLMEIEYRPNI